MEGGEFECNQILDIFCFWLVVVALDFTWVPKNKNIPLKFYVVDLLIKMQISCHCIGHHLIPDTFEYLYPWRITELVDFVLGSLSRGLPGHKNTQQPPLYFAVDDLEYQVGY